MKFLTLLALTVFSANSFAGAICGKVGPIQSTESNEIKEMISVGLHANQDIEFITLKSASSTIILIMAKSLDKEVCIQKSGQYTFVTLKD